MRRLSGSKIHEKNFSLFGATHEFEAKLVEQALKEAGGSVTKAARVLGLPHQTLSTTLSTRHKRLAEKQTPAKKR